MNLIDKLLKNWTGSSIASIMFFYAMFKRYLPHGVLRKAENYVLRLFGYLDSSVQITFPEYSAAHMKRSEAHISIEAYLVAHCSKQAKRLLGELGKDSRSVVLSMDDKEEVIDAYNGAKFTWRVNKVVTKTRENRFYILTFDKKYRAVAEGRYLNHVMEVGKTVRLKNKQRKLYTNNPVHMWSHLVFDHPSTFETLAMEADKKQDIIDDLIAFKKGKEYYLKIGKAWKRGYLLYGPPGTGKSTMIAAIANFMEYDIYDIELTAVHTNAVLRKLLIETSNKSIIVIEDIDCSLDLTGERKKKEAIVTDEEENVKPRSAVTLSGLLNFIDGIWSSASGERIIIFTTNHVEKLDPALIRRGRMDKHIELSYCSFEAFKVLAKNYLDVESHHLFDSIEQLLDKVDITPADVAENLMPKTRTGNFADRYLEELIQTLEKMIATARLKAEKKAKKEQDLSSY